MSRLFHLLLEDSQTLRRTRSIRDNIPQRTDITILRKKTRKESWRHLVRDTGLVVASEVPHRTRGHTGYTTSQVITIKWWSFLRCWCWWRFYDRTNQISRHCLHCYKYWTYTNMNPRLFTSPLIHQPCVVEAGRGLGVVGIVVGLVTGQPSSSSPSLQSRVPSHFELLV